jgi:hypothetical protein
MVVSPVLPAVLPAVVPELPDVLELPELQAASRVTAASAARAVMGRLRNLIPNLLVALSGSVAGIGAGRGRDTRSAVCQENRSDVCVVSMGSKAAEGSRYRTDTFVSSDLWMDLQG